MLLDSLMEEELEEKGNQYAKLEGKILLVLVLLFDNAGAISH